MNNHLKMLSFLSMCMLTFITCGTAQSTDERTKDQWMDLFNGKDLSGWTVKIHHHEVGVNYGKTFRAIDSMIEVRYDQYEGDFNNQFAHLYYDVPYSYYKLQLDYRFVGKLHPGAPSYTMLNSGVMFHSQDPQTMPINQDWPISVEMQFLGGLGDGKPRPTGNMCSPGTEVIYNGQMDPRHCISSSSDTYDGDQWVHAELIVYGDSLIQHLINGDTVLQYTQPQIGGGVANNYLPEQKVDGKLLTMGFIALQSEGQPIDFKNIRLLNLKGCMDPQAKNFKSQYVKSDLGDCKY
jgi:hypothetical protein